jgi:hypothetical protein
MLFLDLSERVLDRYVQQNVPSADGSVLIDGLTPIYSEYTSGTKEALWLYVDGRQAELVRGSALGTAKQSLMLMWPEFQVLRETFGLKATKQARLVGFLDVSPR